MAVTCTAIEAFAAELIDRFGPLPEEGKHLLDIVEIKGLCRQAGIEQGRLKAGHTMAIIAAGIGYVWGGAIVEWGAAP